MAELTPVYSTSSTRLEASPRYGEQGEQYQLNSNPSYPPKNEYGNSFLQGITLKQVVIVILVVYILYWFTTDGPSQLMSTIGKAGEYAAAFGGMWVLFTALSALLPFLQGILSRLFNRGRNYIKQKQALDDIVAQTKARTGKEPTSEEIARLREDNADLLEEAVSADESTKGAAQEKAVDALSDIVEGREPVEVVE
jgi:hypothetical protein